MDTKNTERHHTEDIEPVGRASEHGIFVAALDVVSNLDAVAKIIRLFAAVEPQQYIKKDELPRISISTVDVDTGGATWSTIPPKFNLTTDIVCFRNLSNYKHIRLSFTNPLLAPNPLKILAGETGLLFVPKTNPGQNETTSVALKIMTLDNLGVWVDRNRTGNGAEMGIDNP